MKIDKVDVFLVRIPLKKPVRMADVPHLHFDTVLVRIRSGDLSGWGEVFPGNTPILTDAWSKGVYHCIVECCLPCLLSSVGEVGESSGKSGEFRIDTVASLHERLAPIHGNRHAKAALEMAWLDLDSKRKEQPLYQTIGGSKCSIPVGRCFDRADSPSEFLEDVAAAVSAGFQRITLKIRPGWDINAVAAVRRDHPAITLYGDVEGALTMEKHSEILYRLDDFMLSVLEQPLSASEYVGHAMLQDSLRTTIALDETITSLHQAEIALDLQSAGVFCLKPGRVGGLSEAQAIQQAAAASNVKCYVGTDFLTSIGYRAVASLATLPNCRLPVDYVPVQEWLEFDPGVPLLPVVVNSTDGLVLELWDEPGIGFDPDVTVIEQHAVANHTSPVRGTISSSSTS